MQEVSTGYGLIEGPVWDAAKGLYFSDVLGGGIRLLDRKDQVSIAVPKRRGVGGMALHADGGLVAGGRDIVFIGLSDQRTHVLLDAKTADDATGFNDLTTDAKGRIYVGSLAFKVFGGDPPKPGNLYRIDLDGSVHKVSDGIQLTNGLGFSPDGKRLYHSDARGDVIRVYEVNADGSLKALDEIRLACAGRRRRRPQGRRRRLGVDRRRARRSRGRLRARRPSSQGHCRAAADGDEPVFRRRRHEGSLCRHGIARRAEGELRHGLSHARRCRGIAAGARTRPKSR